MYGSGLTLVNHNYRRWVSLDRHVRDGGMVVDKSDGLPCIGVRLSVSSPTTGICALDSRLID